MPLCLFPESFKSHRHFGLQVPQLGHRQGKGQTKEEEQNEEVMTSDTELQMERKGMYLLRLPKTSSFAAFQWTSVHHPWYVSSLAKESGNKIFVRHARKVATVTGSSLLDNSNPPVLCYALQNFQILFPFLPFTYFLKFNLLG